MSVSAKVIGTGVFLLVVVGLAFFMLVGQRAGIELAPNFHWNSPAKEPVMEVQIEAPAKEPVMPATGAEVTYPDWGDQVPWDAAVPVNWQPIIDGIDILDFDGAKDIVNDMLARAQVCVLHSGPELFQQDPHYARLVYDTLCSGGCLDPKLWLCIDLNAPLRVFRVQTLIGCGLAGLPHLQGRAVLTWSFQRPECVWLVHTDVRDTDRFLSLWERPICIPLLIPGLTDILSNLACPDYGVIP